MKVNEGPGGLKTSDHQRRDKQIDTARSTCVKIIAPFTFLTAENTFPAYPSHPRKKIRSMTQSKSNWAFDYENSWNAKLSLFFSSQNHYVSWKRKTDFPASRSKNNVKGPKRVLVHFNSRSFAPVRTPCSWRKSRRTRLDWCNERCRWARALVPALHE